MSDKEVLKKILKRYFENNSKNKVITIITFGIILAGVSILEPFFMKEVIAIIEKYIETKEFNLNYLVYVFIFWGAFILGVNFFRIIYEKLLANTNLDNYKLNHLIESKRLLSMNYGEFLGRKQGKMYKNYDRGIEAQLEIIYFIFAELLFAFFGVIIAIIILFIIDVKMAIVSLVLLPVVLYIGYFFNKKTRTIQDELNENRDEAFGYFGDGINNLGLLKTLSMKDKVLELIKGDIIKADKKQKKVIYRWIIADVYTQFILMLARFLVLSFGIYFLINGEISFALLFLFISYIPQIYYPIGFIFKRLQNVQKQLSSVRKFYTEFDNLGLDTDLKKSKTVQKINGNIEFRNVNFGYTKDKKILKNLSFNIKPGEKVAFVGNTGAGKSTIINLIFRFWDIDSGEILLDSKNINYIVKDSLRKNIGLVAQDVSLFNTSIKDNLLFAKFDASEAEIEKALKSAQADFVLKLKDGINTIIGERGLKLSGGEKQRISIARLFLKNPSILILDEATSALDNKTERLVQKALDKLMNGRTSIVIAHRLSTIQNVDKIYMLEEGKIVEEGNYEELMAKKAKFYELANPSHLIIN